MQVDTVPSQVLQISHYQFFNLCKENWGFFADIQINFFLNVFMPLLLLLLLLSRFSRVRLCATPQTAAHQAPLSLGFSRQEHWSGLPFPSPVHERKSEIEVAESCPTLCDPMDCSLPGSSVHIHTYKDDSRHNLPALLLTVSLESLPAF